MLYFSCSHSHPIPPSHIRNWRKSSAVRASWISRTRTSANSGRASIGWLQQTSTRARWIEFFLMRIVWGFEWFLFLCVIMCIGVVGRAQQQIWRLSVGMADWQAQARQTSTRARVGRCNCLLFSWVRRVLWLLYSQERCGDHVVFISMSCAIVYGVMLYCFYENVCRAPPCLLAHFFFIPFSSLRSCPFTSPCCLKQRSSSFDSPTILQPTLKRTVRGFFLFFFFN